MYSQGVLVITMLLALNSCHGSFFDIDVNCPQVCPALFAPICADNGQMVKQFDNPCELKAANCRQSRSGLQPFIQIDIAWCTSRFVDNLTQEMSNLDLNSSGCLRACPMIYQPICITNNRIRGTLSNSCLLDIFNCVLRQRKVDETGYMRLLKDGPCK